MVVRVLTLRTAGTNCDWEAMSAFRRAGAEVDHRHVRELFEQPSDLGKYQVVLFPGGFSYGDDIAAGQILAVETRLFLFEELSRFVDSGGIVLGICNGFQVLVKAGLLPGWDRGKQEVTLTYNDQGKFEDRWVRLRVERSRCTFLPQGWSFDVPVAHAEGKLISLPGGAERLEKEGLVALKYVDGEGHPTQTYPDNPNGSEGAIAGLCDPTGRILGLMPHPERNSWNHHHPTWTRKDTKGEGEGLRFFEAVVRAAGN